MHIPDDSYGALVECYLTGKERVDEELLQCHCIHQSSIDYSVNEPGPQ